MKPTILYFFSGLPAVGKSSLAKRLAKHLQTTYIRIDTIECIMSNFCKITADEGYQVACKIIADNLRLGNNVVVDSCNPVEHTRKHYEQIAEENGCEFVNIEIVCSDKIEHQRRLEVRNVEIQAANLYEPIVGWRDVEARQYDEWNDDHITVDTARKTIQACFDDLLKRICAMINTHLSNNSVSHEELN